MKCYDALICDGAVRSPPSRGAWIEMSRSIRVLSTKTVAPLAGGVD